MKNSHSFPDPREPALSPQHLSGPGPSSPWVAQACLPVTDPAVSSSDPDPACLSLTEAMNPCATWSQLWFLLGPTLVHSSFFMIICKAAGHRTTSYCPAMCTRVFRRGQAGAGVSLGFMDGAYPQGPALSREGQGPASQQTWCPHPHLRGLNTLVRAPRGPEHLCGFSLVLRWQF